MYSTVLKGVTLLLLYSVVAVRVVAYVLVVLLPAYFWVLFHVTCTLSGVPRGARRGYGKLTTTPYGPANKKTATTRKAQSTTVEPPLNKP